MLNLIETGGVGAHSQADEAVIKRNVEGAIRIFNGEMRWGDGNQLRAHVLFHVMFIEHGQHGIFSNDVQVASRRVLHLDKHGAGAARGEVFNNVQTHGARADDGDAFTRCIGKLVQMMNHVGNGEDVAAFDIDVFTQPFNRR